MIESSVSQGPKTRKVSADDLRSSEYRDLSFRQSFMNSETSLYIRSKAETVLVQKGSNKIDMMRLKQYANDMKNIRMVPKISLISQQIIDLKEGKPNKSASKYAKTIVNTSRSSAGFQMHPKQTFLSIANLENSNQATGNLQIDKKAFNKTLSATKFGLKDKSLKNFIKDDGKELKHATIEELKSALMRRKKFVEPEQNTADILAMTVLQRNDFWLTERNKKIQMEKEIKDKLEAETCPFSPRLVPRVCLNKIYKNRQAKNFSYSQKYAQKTDLEPNLLKKQEPKVSEKEPAKYTVYKPITPHKKSISQDFSNLLKKSVPMIPYKT
jgi:hypothetical protein